MCCVLILSDYVYGLRNFVVLFCPGGCTGSQVAKSRRRGDGGFGGAGRRGSKQGEVRKAGERAI